MRNNQIPWLRQTYLREKKLIGRTGNVMIGNKTVINDFGEAIGTKKIYLAHRQRYE